MYLYCSKCHWMQDDFWHWSPTDSEGNYTPLDTLLKDAEYLCDCLVNFTSVPMDSYVAEMEGLNYETLEDGSVRVPAVEYVAHQLEVVLRRISGMIFRKEEDWYRYHEKHRNKCPVCGEDGLEIVEVD